MLYDDNRLWRKTPLVGGDERIPIIEFDEAYNSSKLVFDGFLSSFLSI
jgi:hypothetical protein